MAGEFGVMVRAAAERGASRAGVLAELAGSVSGVAGGGLMDGVRGG